MTPMPDVKKPTIRELALKVSSFRTETKHLTFPGADGPVDVLIRQPSVAQRNQILSAMGALDGRRDQNGSVTAVLLCVLDPISQKPVFEEADRDALLSSPAGGWVDDLVSSVFALMAAGEDAAKN